MNRVFRNTIFYLLILLVVIGVVSYFQTSNPKTENMSYSTFIKNLDDGKVDSVSVQPVRGVYEVKGQLKNYDKDQYFLTHVPEGKGADQIFNALKKTDVKVEPRARNKRMGDVPDDHHPICHYLYSVFLPAQSGSRRRQPCHELWQE